MPRFASAKKEMDLAPTQIHERVARSLVRHEGHVEAAGKRQDNADIKGFYLGLSQVGARNSYWDVKHCA